MEQMQASINASNRTASAASRRDTQVVDGKLIDMQTGEVISDLSGSPETNALGNALAENDIYNINNILNSKGMDSAVGPTGLARTEPGLWAATKRFVSGFFGAAAVAGVVTAPTVVATIPSMLIAGLTVGTINALRGTKDEFTGDRADFIGSVEQMIAGLTTDKLAQAKGQGITFGALSDGERDMIAKSATKIGTWRQREDNAVDGKVIGYEIDEKNFKEELDTINYFKQLDAYLQGASAESIGAVEQADGTVWVMDSFGNMRQLISTGI
jgi:hypothetical protein